MAVKDPFKWKNMNKVEKINFCVVLFILILSAIGFGFIIAMIGI